MQSARQPGTPTHHEVAPNPKLSTSASTSSRSVHVTLRSQKFDFERGVVGRVTSASIDGAFAFRRSTLPGFFFFFLFASTRRSRRTLVAPFAHEIRPLFRDRIADAVAARPIICAAGSADLAVVPIRDRCSTRLTRKPRPARMGSSIQYVSTVRRPRKKNSNARRANRTSPSGRTRLTGRFDTTARVERERLDRDPPGRDRRASDLDPARPGRRPRRTSTPRDRSRGFLSTGVADPTSPRRLVVSNWASNAEPLLRLLRCGRQPTAAPRTHPLRASQGRRELPAMRFRPRPRRPWSRAAGRDLVVAARTPRRGAVSSEPGPWRNNSVSKCCPCRATLRVSSPVDRPPRVILTARSPFISVDNPVAFLQ